MIEKTDEPSGRKSDEQTDEIVGTTGEKSRKERWSDEKSDEKC